MYCPRINKAGPILTLLLALVCTTTGHAEKVTVNEESGTAYRNGLDLFKKGKYEQAAGLFEKAYASDERNINALFAHGTSLMRLGKNNEASELFKLVLTKDERHVKTHRLLPVALTNAGQTDEALAAYDTGMNMFSGNYNFPFGKAVLLMKLGRNRDAIPLLVKAAEMEPDRVDVLEKLMFAYRESGDVEKGYITAQNILDKDPKHSWSLVMAGDYFRTSEKYQKALETYGQAAKSIDTKAYAEHYIDVINQILEELEIEKEYQERMKKE